MKIRIWGSRGSTPSPLKPAEIEAKICQAIYQMPPKIDTTNFEAIRAYVQQLPPLLKGTAGGNTSCVEIQTDKDIFIMDAGSGLRDLGLSLMDGPCGRGEGHIHLFFSHPHWDHIQGFPFFRPAFIKGNKISIYSLHNLEMALHEQQRALNFPVPVSYMQADIAFISLQPGVPFQVNDVRINTLENQHPGKAYSYRFADQHSTFVYANDAEYPQLDDDSLQPYIDFFHQADALIFDAQYTLKEAWQKVDWGHSSAMIGVDMARAAGVKRLLLFHHEPTSTDQQLLEIQDKARAYQAQDKSRPTCEVQVAYEGLELDLIPAGTIDTRLMPAYDSAVLTPRSLFDGTSVSQLEQKLDNLATLNYLTSSIIDLSQVETLTTTELKALVSLHRDREATQLVLASPSPGVQQVIELNDYSNLFAIYPSVEAACAAIEAREAVNLPGHIINNRYQMIDRIGAGRLGTTLKAKDIETDQIVALKLLSPTFSERTIEQFLQHTHNIINLNHQHIVTIFDADVTDGIAFVVEEFVDGTSLEDQLTDSTSPLPYDQALDIAFDIALALDFAHTYGALHGDLKPHNIFFTDQGVKVSDFGLGRLEEGHNLLNSPLLFLTSPYLAPEQVRGEPITARTDLYAFGVILYQIFTGQLPYHGTEKEILQAHVNPQELPSSPRELNPQISPVLAHLILKLLAHNPNDRYQNARQVRRNLSGLATQSGQTVRHCRWPLIGREDQLQQLQQRWQLARQGQGQLTLIGGEAGVGKTVLAQRAAFVSKASTMIMAQCQPWQGSLDFQPFRDILLTYLDRQPAAAIITSEMVPLLTNLARFIPELEERLPALSLAPDSTKTVAADFMTTFTQLMAIATAQEPWFLIVDDLQWADPNTMVMLNHLTHHLSEMHLFVVCIAEADREADLYAAIPNFDPACPHQVIYLNPFDDHQVGQFLASIWEQAVPESVTQKLVHHSGGNPFLVEEMAKELVDDGLVSFQDNTWHFSVLDTVHMPENLREAIWRHTRLLRPDTQRLLRRATILGPYFRFEDLQTLSELNSKQLLNHLDTALEHHLIQEYASRPGYLTFTHALIRSILYEDFSGERRRLLHQQAAEMFESLAEQSGQDFGFQLAYHFKAAHNWPRALDYALRSSQQARHIQAPDAARFWLQQGLKTMQLIAVNDQAANDQPDLALKQLVFAELGFTLGVVAEISPLLETAIQTFEQRNMAVELATARILQQKIAAHTT